MFRRDKFWRHPRPVWILPIVVLAMTICEVWVVPERHRSYFGGITSGISFWMVYEGIVEAWALKHR